jgi:thiaminase/transcriptional activator TenA
VGATTNELWEAIRPIWDRILEHPFVAGLTDGTLPEESFRFYVVQDAHYLREFARALALLGARAPGEDEIRLFAEHAASAIVVERELHAGFLAGWGLSEADVSATPQAPTCLAYCSYMLAACHGGTFAEGLGAVQPCYWIYREVGRELAARGSPSPLYRRWIDTYGGEEFAAVVDAVLAIADRVGEDLAARDRAAMRERFVVTSRYEWMFWDMGWRREEWPV